MVLFSHQRDRLAVLNHLSLSCSKAVNTFREEKFSSTLQGSSSWSKHQIDMNQINWRKSQSLCIYGDAIDMNSKDSQEQ